MAMKKEHHKHHLSRKDEVKGGKDSHKKAAHHGKAKSTHGHKMAKHKGK